MTQPAPTMVYNYGGTNGTANLMDQILAIEREKAELRKQVDDQCAGARSLRSELEALEHENEALRNVNSSLTTQVQSLERRAGRFMSLAQRMESSTQRMEQMSMSQSSWAAMPSSFALPMDACETLNKVSGVQQASNWAPQPQAATSQQRSDSKSISVEKITSMQDCPASPKNAKASKTDW